MSYTINVVRSNGTGTLTFKSGTVNISETCWWDQDVVIDAGTYTGYATRMANKDDGTDGGKREGIWLGKGVPYNGDGSTANGFFIHKGTGPSWSDGCIVLSGSKVYEMWSEITPKETGNISVVIKDETVRRGRPRDWDCTRGMHSLWGGMPSF
ncbi:hypothetical protein MWU54_06220 [Marivita sp. S6314]|uniref:hypothetical protein n=1 Tax=Marivita sp. S6314 TaxID=2926406 RepID=UPI001FF1EB6E|nr:hypothetical protein [Marivita sp. S6314]MCK0149609.1 hypothetical protein [Marivita sp. S6314]